MATRSGACWIWIATRIACPSRRRHPRRRMIQWPPIKVFSAQRRARFRGHDNGEHRSAADHEDQNSPHRRRVLDAALGPEPVNAAADAELRTRSHVAFEHFAVVADLPDDAHHPILGQAELLAEITLDAQEAPDLGLVRFERFVDVLGGYPELLGIEHG